MGTAEAGRACDVLRMTLRVLVVDDSEDDFDLIRRALSRAFPDCHASRVETRAAMRDALAEGALDVVIVDWILPQFDAPAALELLCELSPRPVCIVVSGARGEQRAVTALKLGARDFLLKDELDQLAGVLERELAFRGG